MFVAPSHEFSLNITSSHSPVLSFAVGFHSHNDAFSQAGFNNHNIIIKYKKKIRTEKEN
jgi:hypothetical protein